MLLKRFDTINDTIPSATNTLIHATLANEILAIDPNLPGDVIECGCYKGASSAALSIVCAITNRKLIICNSFEGLPDDGGCLHIGIHARTYGYYERGMWAATRQEVEANIRAHGELSVCSFIEGYLKDSLTALRGPIVFAFFDVDLESSTRDALSYVWPLLADNCAIYTDDAADMACVVPFFDEAWWQKNFASKAPGFVGSGCGLPSAPAIASIGYTRKQAGSAGLTRVPWLIYPDQRSEFE